MAPNLQPQGKAFAPTSPQLYSPAFLESQNTDLLHDLTALINLCYSIGHTTSPHGILLPYSRQRLATDVSLIGEVGTEGFILVLFSQESQGEKKPIASISAKPFKILRHDELAEGSELLTSFKRRAAAPQSTSTSRDTAQHDKADIAHEAQIPLETLADLPQWEIICNVVHPDYQRRGIAGQMFNAMTSEIRNRISGNNEKRIHLVITTMKEMNETYYQKRGFVTTRETRFEKGTAGSEVGFSIVEMERIV
ncbi:MAG: hypothetical protein L6R41_003724 [Letrouitia leprolyta]|nr:MAG: hypothetical protein L6R41_003724 [Letrouitia leprolyta]